MRRDKYIKGEVFTRPKIKIGDKVSFRADVKYIVSEVLQRDYFSDFYPGRVLDIDDRGWLKVKWDLTERDIADNVKELPDDMLEFRDPDLFEVVE